MAGFYRLVATPSFKKYGGSGPLVVELGPTIDPPPSGLPANTYQMQLAEPTVATAEAPLPDGRQFWSFTGSETWMILSAAEPGVAVGYVADQYYENNFQAIACPPANFPESQGYWSIDPGRAWTIRSHMRCRTRSCQPTTTAWPFTTLTYRREPSSSCSRTTPVPSRRTRTSTPSRLSRTGGYLFSSRRRGGMNKASPATS